MPRTFSFARFAVAAFTSTGVALSAGCSAFQPKLQDVTINSFPAGASINVDGSDVGVAPVTVKLERNQRHTLVASLGNQAMTRNLNPHVSTTGILDIIGGVLFLVPAIGIATPGFWTVSDQHPTLILPMAANGSAVSQEGSSQVASPKAKPVTVIAPSTPKPTAPDSSDPRFKPAPRVKVYDN